ncbi:hypothetical protein L9F63_006267, partial [Diploptera punctata]
CKSNLIIERIVNNNCITIFILSLLMYILIFFLEICGLYERYMINCEYIKSPFTNHFFLKTHFCTYAFVWIFFFLMLPSITAAVFP